MKKVNTNCKIPIKMWLNDLEEGAVEQAENLANLPYAFKHIAVLPDGHRGFGMLISSVCASLSTVSPNMVGQDIGCGVVSMKTSLKTSDITESQLKDIISEARSLIPVGFNWHKESQGEEWLPSVPDVIGTSGFDVTYPIINHNLTKALTQVGTLGGGNHFVEIQHDEDDNIWVMIHSGSRNLGHTVATHYNKKAEELNALWHSEVKKDTGLAFLPLSTKEGRDYMNEMDYCIKFALMNRKLMMQRMRESITTVMTRDCLMHGFEPIINKCHNMATWENHFGKNVIVHRKGATRAYAGETGMVPGNQGASSYIVKGKGNKESFMSCSHGAGRKLGRKAAQRELSLEDEIKRLDEVGTLHSVRTKADLDEAPSAYKDIEEVMANQSDLIDIVVKLTPMATMKG